MRRRLRLMAGSFALSALGTFIALEWRRQNQPQSAALPEDRAAAVQDVSALPNLAEPAAFAAFQEKLRTQYFAMDERYKALQHRRTQKTIQKDGAGATLLEEEAIETVRFRGEAEDHRHVRTRNLKTGKETSGESSAAKDLSVGNEPFFYPYSKREGPDDFEYRFAGFEQLDGKTLAKVAFVPRPPLGRKLQGHAWADPATGEPIRFRAKWAAPKFPCDRLEMIVEYGPAENGAKQVRHVATDAGGGLAFIRRRYLIDIVFDDYRAP